MSWTYSGEPNTSDKDKVRFLIGDTDPDYPLVQDEEIQFALDSESNIYAAAAKCCEAIAARFSREVDRKMGSISIQASQKVEAYRRLARQLREKAKIAQLPFSGTIETKPTFAKGMMDYV